MAERESQENMVWSGSGCQASFALCREVVVDDIQSRCMHRRREAAIRDSGPCVCRNECNRCWLSELSEGEKLKDRGHLAAFLFIMFADVVVTAKGVTERNGREGGNG
jgi:hypothetical protein